MCFFMHGGIYSKDIVIMNIGKHPVQTTTISRQIQTVIQDAGIDIALCKAHSTRAATTSAAPHNVVQIDTILQTAGWSSEATFAKYYNKEILDKQSTYAVSLHSA